LSLAALTLTCAALLCSGCASTGGAVSSRIYQPQTLRLSKGTQVQTRDGDYIAQTDEVWYSAALYEQRAREAEALAAALQQFRQQEKQSP
jgi:hypothetical protein